MITRNLVSAARFFEAGGTLNESSPSYVRRSADDELLCHVLDGQFCYVLTARQMGKSSLMVRTASKLRQQGIYTVVIDLSSIGTRITPEQWYHGILSELTYTLALPIDLSAWWAERQILSPLQRFNSFLETVVLTHVSERIVFFLDEIDSTLKLNFTDDFFAAIRALYNQRASNPNYNRLTFVLLGVASPDDLIKDRTRTPFNIGQAIRLREFAIAELVPLQQCMQQLFGERGSPIIERIFYWTSGHPYLTQKLCEKVAAGAGQSWDDTEIDALVQSLFLSPDASPDSNLASVRNAMMASEIGVSERQQLFQLYAQVYGGGQVEENELSPLQNRLKLIGLVRAERGRLCVRNRIYERVFNTAWIRTHTPVNWRRRSAIGAVALSLVVVALVVVGMRLQAEQMRVAEIKNLAGICQVAPADAQNRFFNKPEADSIDLFQVKPNGIEQDYLAVVDCLAPAISQSTYSAASQQQLRFSICCTLQQIGSPESLSAANRLECSAGCAR